MLITWEDLNSIDATSVVIHVMMCLLWINTRSKLTIKPSSRDHSKVKPVNWVPSQEIRECQNNVTHITSKAKVQNHMRIQKHSMNSSKKKIVYLFVAETSRLSTCLCSAQFVHNPSLCSLKWTLIWLMFTTWVDRSFTSVALASVLLHLMMCLISTNTRSSPTFKPNCKTHLKEWSKFLVKNRKCQI